MYSKYKGTISPFYIWKNKSDILILINCIIVTLHNYISLKLQEVDTNKGIKKYFGP